MKNKIRICCLLAFVSLGPVTRAQSVEELTKSADTATQTRNYDEAIADWTAVLTLQPENFSAYYNRGMVKFRKKDFKGAEIDFNKAISINPRFTYAYYDRAIVKSITQDYDGAIADYNKVIELDPTLAQAYCQRGESKTHRTLHGRDAINDFNRAIQLNPNYGLAYYSRGNEKQLDVMYARDLADRKGSISTDDRSELDSALADYNQAITLNYTNSLVYSNRGRVKHLENDLDGALDDFAKANAMEPQFPSFYDIGVIKIEKHEYSQAIEAFNRDIELWDQARAYFQRGLAKQLLKDSPGALADFNKAIELEPNNPDFKQAKVNLQNISPDRTTPNPAAVRTND